MKKFNKFTTIFVLIIILVTSIISGLSISTEATMKTSSFSSSGILDNYVIEGVPYVSQETNIFCAYAGCTMLLNYQADVNTTLDEILYLGGIGYSLLYPIPSEDSLPMIATILCQSEDYITSYFGYTTETWKADSINLSLDVCWNEYWSKVKKNISTNNPLITTVNPFRLSSLRNLVDFKIPEWLIDIFPPSGHAIVLVGYNESNQTICYMDPVAGYFGQPELGTYAWMNLKIFRKSLEDINKTIGFPFRITKIIKLGSPGLSKQERFEKAHKINIERLKGNNSAYIENDLKILSKIFGFSDYKLGINATKIINNNFDKGFNNRIKTIQVFKKVGKFGLKYYFTVYILPIFLKIINLPSYVNEKFSQTKFDKIAIEKNYTANFLMKNSYVGEASLFKLESQNWKTLSEYYNVFMKKGVFLSFPRALTLINKMHSTLDNIIEIETKIINYSSLDIDQNITTFINANHIASVSAGIIKNNSIAWYGSYGYYKGINTNLFKKTPNKDTIYMAGSISKTITATAIMQLYEKGFFNLSDNVSLYLPFDLKNPNFPNQVITIQMLLNHTSSLKTEKLRALFISGFSIITGYPLKFLEETLLKDGKLYRDYYWRNDTPPGVDYQYSNMGYAVLEYLVEYFSHQTFEEYCKDNIFEPLNMSNTSFHYVDFNKNQQAPAHLWRNGVYIKLYYDVPLSSAGGLRTTVEDLSHFLIAHMNNGVYKGVRILNNDTACLMHNSSSVEDDIDSIAKKNNIPDYVSNYGLGWIIYNSTYYKMDYSGHDGDTFGSHAIMRMNPSNKTGIIIFWNSDAKFDGYRGPWDVWLPLEKELLKKAKEL
jgi:CubicO group peptidase (beta-lactamase class C family)